jgi:spore maturation protein CgeB
MDILIIGQFHTEGFGLHISETLKEMGHNPFCFEPGIKFSSKSIFGKRWNNITHTLYIEILSKIRSYRNIKFSKLYKSLTTFKADLTIVLHDFLLPEEVDKIKQLTNSPIVLWFPDAIVNFGKSAFLISDYDCLFFSDKYIVDELRETLNLNTFYLPQCFNPKYHRKIELTQQDYEYYGCDITNAGNMYPNRMALYSQLLQYKIKMWGSPPAIWMNPQKIEHILMRKSVYNEEKAKAFLAAKIVLNNLHPSVIDGTNKRAFEIPACGGFQITSWKPSIKELFIDGKEIVTYKTYKELIEKIDYYLNHEEERQQIAAAGMRRAQKSTHISTV